MVNFADTSTSTLSKW